MGKQSRLRREKFEKVAFARERIDVSKRARFYDRCLLDSSCWVVPPGAIVIDGSNVMNAINYAAYADGQVQEIPVAKLPFESLFIEFGTSWLSDDFGASPLNASGVYFDSEEGEAYATADVLVEGAADGEIVQIGGFDIRYGDVDISDLQSISASVIKHLRCIAHSALYVLNLLQCNNIELIEHESPTETSRLYERHFRKPMTKYKTLRIKQTGKQYSTENSQPRQDIVPLHLRRGGWMHFTEDAPAFGKPWGVGTFWRPATVVGNEKNGVVVKDYEVEAPKI